MKKNYLLFLTFLMLLFFGFSYSQQKQVTGTVKSQEDNAALPGVNVVLKGTSVGTVTDFDGKFSVSVSDNATLVFSFIGYVTKEVSVGNKTSLDVTMVPDVVSLAGVTVLGSRRGEARSTIESPVPIDIITADQIEKTGFTQTTEILEFLVPSYSAPKPSLADGTDHVRPASLRGLAPDHTLVLVNGKRRHTSAMIHVNGTFGRGSTGVDLNAIPPSSISKIEVLRDGASAQYGSDAIAGVINIVLKDKKGFDASFTQGMHLTSYERGYDPREALAPGQTVADLAETSLYFNHWHVEKKEETIIDGHRTILHAGYGFDLGDDASLYVSGQVRLQGKANRAGKDPRYNYFLSDADGNQSLEFIDTTFNVVDKREETFDRLNHWYGQSESNDYSLFLNGTVKVGQSEFYYFGGGSYRSSTGPCYYRRSLDDRTVRAIYPDGFLPQISPVIMDGSLALGNKGKFGEWNYDISQTFGYNDFNFRVVNTHNTALGTRDDQQDQFDIGNLVFFQATTNVDFHRAFQTSLFPLSVAFGAEFRNENYKIKDGEPASYFPDPADPSQVNAGILDGPNKGTPARTGCQCLTGFSPASAIDKGRTNVGMYVDLEADVSDSWTLGLAGRFENYSDFGSTATGKLATRVAISPSVALRGSVSTGFRAPAMAQINYGSISTNAIANVLVEVGHFPVESETAKALGASPLTPETSVNVSAGLTIDKGNFKFTLDAYNIDISDRIVLGENFEGIKQKDANDKNKEVDLLAQFLQTQGVNATGGRYFTNALNTTTRGLDIVASYNMDVNDNSKLLFTLSANLNRTKVNNKENLGSPEKLKAYSSTPILERYNVSRLEEQTPRSKYNFNTDFTTGKFGVNLMISRYGEYTVLSEASELYDQTFSPEIVTNLEARYDVSESFKVALGANNLFDNYPDKAFKGDSFRGIFPFSQSTPFSFLGRYVYLRANFTL